MLPDYFSKSPEADNLKLSSQQGQLPERKQLPKFYQALYIPNMLAKKKTKFKTISDESRRTIPTTNHDADPTINAK
jgi:hypothetical protein